MSSPEFTPTREMLNLIAEKLRIDPNGRHMRRLVEDQYRRGRGEEAPEDPEDEARLALPVLAHLRGKQGVKLPTPEEQVPVIEVTEEQKAEMIAAFTQGQREVVDQMRTVPDLPNCRVSRTVKTPTGFKGDRKDKRALFDMLFMRKSELPLNPDEVFGMNTFVQPFSTDKPNAPSLSTVGMGVPCLPYRMRVTRSFSFRDEGLNALRNYDEDPQGEGILHESLNGRRTEFQ